MKTIHIKQTNFQKHDSSRLLNVILLTAVVEVFFIVAAIFGGAR